MKLHTRFLYMATFFTVCLSVHCIGQTDQDMERVNKTRKINQIQVLGSHNSYKEAITPALMSIIEKDNPKLARSLDNSHVSLAEQLDISYKYS
ncbi:Ca2+-dependent phosphoinositide-specific phospholipase C [Planctomycetota bacterium]